MSGNALYVHYVVGLTLPNTLRRGDKTACSKYAKQCIYVTGLKKSVTCKECLKKIGV